MGKWEDAGDTDPRPERDPGEDLPKWRNRIKAALDKFNAASQRWSEAARQLEDVLAQLRRAEDELIGLREALPQAEAQLAETVRAIGDNQVMLMAAEATRAELEQRYEEHRSAYEFASAKVLGMVPLELPLLLLPVRLETKLIATGPTCELLARIYPDDLHIDTHEPELTEDEWEWVAHYRKARTGPDPQPRLAWAQLCQQFGRTRAAWIAKMAQHEPGTDRPHRAGSWTRPAQTTVLPDRWILFAQQKGAPVVTAWGNPIPDPLATGPTPQPNGNDGHPLFEDPAIAWMFDFDEAVKVGMGIRVPLTLEQAERGFDSVMVVGLKAYLSNKDLWKPGDETVSVDRFVRLLDAHHFTNGLGLVPRNTPTNNTSDVGSGHSSKDLTTDESYALERQGALIQSEDGSDGAMLAKALGITIDPLSHLPHADMEEQRRAQAMNGALWGVMQSDLLAQLGEEGVGGPQAKFLSAHFQDYVRSGGPLPVIRVGAQPYGMLPVTAFRTWQPVTPSAEVETLVSRLRRALPRWRAAAERVPTAATALTVSSLLREEAVSCRYVLRTLHPDDGAAPLDITRRSVDPADATRDDPYDRDPLVPNFVSFLAESSYESLQAESYPDWDAKAAPLPHSLLYLLMRHAAMRVMHPEGEAGEAEREAFRKNLRALAPCSPAVLRTLMAETMDAAIHRLDAWIGSMATKRLAELRQRQPNGFCLGAYGWVENLRPAPALKAVGHVPEQPGIPLVEDPANKGFIQAPSLSQAATCAVLRSGYLSHQHRSDGALGVDLSSARVKQAHGLLDAVRQGQPLAALLGYRFERSLHEQQLDHFIMPFRLLASFKSEDKVSIAMQQEQQAKLAYRSMEAKARDAQKSLDEAVIQVRIKQKELDEATAQITLLDKVLQAFTTLNEKQRALETLDAQIGEH